MAASNGGPRYGIRAESSEKPTVTVQRYYECLGAPALLYRCIEDHYSLLDEHAEDEIDDDQQRDIGRFGGFDGVGSAGDPPRSSSHRDEDNDRHHRGRRCSEKRFRRSRQRKAQGITEEFRRRRRSYARWYYPLDCHVVLPTLPFLGTLPVPGPLSLEPPPSQPTTGTDDHSHHEEDHDPGNRPTHTLTDENVDWDLIKRHSFPLLDEARAQLLWATAAVPKPSAPPASAPPPKGDDDDDDEDVDPSIPPPALGDARAHFHQEQVLRAYQRFDRNWVQSGRAHGGESSDAELGRQLSRAFDRERLDLADPAYLAPFPTASVEWAGRRDPPEDASNAYRPFVASHQDYPNDPRSYGNTLLAVPCACPACRSHGGPVSWFVLQPCGPLLEWVALFLLRFPVDDASLDDAGDDQQEGAGAGAGADTVLDLEDPIRQLCQCGTSTYVARTSAQCIIFTVQFHSSGPDELQVCGKRGILKLLHRIDLRPVPSSRGHPYYRPSWVACHPRYGNAYADANLVAVWEDAAFTAQRNTLLHIQADSSSSSSCRTTRHTVSNLQDVSQIDFSAHQPMVLWSVARSHVRPGLARKHLGLAPHVGHGHSLYSIDLRCDCAAFQWSPSAAKYEPEGTHSLSGLWTDWSTDHSLWVASISARTTWELDSRMPCRPVSAWSLPHACDDRGPVPPSRGGLHGAGTLFARPIRDPAVVATTAQPILSVALTPGAWGVHLYQRPVHGPRFRTQPLECAAHPGLASALGDETVSVASSSVVRLPDVSDRVFTCGLACLSVPVDQILSEGALDRLVYDRRDVDSVLCVLSFASSGDLYCQALLESRASYRRGRACESLPLGVSAVAVDDLDVGATQTDGPSSTAGRLVFRLGNEWPRPNSAVPQPPSIHPTVPNLPSDPAPADSIAEAKEPAATVVWKASPSSEFVVCKATRREPFEPDVSLRIDSTVQESLDDRLRTKLDRFDHQSARVARRLDEDYRCDVTPHVAAMAARAWPNLSDTSSSDDDDNDDDSTAYATARSTSDDAEAHSSPDYLT